MNPYDVLQIKENYEDLNEFYSEETDKKIKDNYIAIKNFYENKIKEYMEKYKLSVEDIVGENYSEKVERAFGKFDQQNEFEYFNKCVDEIENAEKIIQNSKEKIEELNEAYARIKKPAERVIEYVKQIKIKQRDTNSSSIEFRSEIQSAEFRKMIFDELGFKTLNDGESLLAKVYEFFKTRNKLKSLSNEKRKQLKEYLKLCLDNQTEMTPIKIENMPDGVEVYIKPSDLDIEYTRAPGNIIDSFGVYDLSIVTENGEKMTKTVFTEKNAILRKILENPMYSKKLSKTIFSLENIMYALRENDGFLGIPVIKQTIFKQEGLDKIQDTYIGYNWDPYMHEAVKSYLSKEKEHEILGEEQEL